MVSTTDAGTLTHHQNAYTRYAKLSAFVHSRHFLVHPPDFPPTLEHEN